MKRLAIVTGILALAAPLALAQTSTWKSDTAHSEVDFSIKHLGVSNVHGRFGKINATLVFNEADITKSTVTATIGVDTVDTGEEARNTHLKTADFFDVANLPTATFTSTSVAKNGSNLTVSGNLTLHGVTKRAGSRDGSQAARRFLGLDHHQPHGLRHRNQVSKRHSGRRREADHRTRCGQAVSSNEGMKTAPAAFILPECGRRRRGDWKWQA